MAALESSTYSVVPIYVFELAVIIVLYKRGLDLNALGMPHDRCRPVSRPGQSTHQLELVLMTGESPPIICVTQAPPVLCPIAMDGIHEG
jgi:hypothetical protein